MCDLFPRGYLGIRFFSIHTLDLSPQPDFPVADEGSKRIPCYRSPTKHVVINPTGDWHPAWGVDTRHCDVNIGF